jgi:hypothetical protein
LNAAVKLLIAIDAEYVSDSEHAAALIHVLVTRAASKYHKKVRRGTKLKKVQAA